MMGKVSKTTEELLEEVETLRNQLKIAKEKLYKLENAFGTTEIGITITDPEKRILYTNPADAKMHGYTVQELIGKSAIIYAQRNPPETKKNANPPKEIFNWKRETFNIRKDGCLFPVELISNPIKDENNKTIGWVTICTDITERKYTEDALRRSEANLRAILDNTFQAFLLIDRDLKVLSFNNMANEWAELMFENTIVAGSYVTDFILPENMSEFAEIFDQVFNGEQIRLEKEIEVIGDIDINNWFEYYFNPVFRGNEVVGICMSFLDITERKRAEEELGKYREHLEQLIEECGSE